ncbi:head-tail adaptor protein [Salipiger sp. IMCC34102]|uniref:head-tail adaptor protein n=1 Tax=Salipiger sp. IMCC34102 TaxID=2510647 RepID=UPI00101CB7FA|nr:head-tail adaptor protein [Salipiger sp. IMCC34102]RYH03375.1 head-tail adaptor protein [Salipiger sp. IMCC34102]
MSPPRLTRRLRLETPVEVADGAGGYLTDWRPLGHLWAEVAPGTGRARGAGETVLSRVSLKITLRFAAPSSDARPRPGQRFVEGTRRYAIEAVTERDASRAYLICTAQEENVT